jgi:hypothetical protein
LASMNADDCERLQLGIWLIAAILVLLVTSVVGIIPLVRIVRGLLS